MMSDVPLSENLTERQQVLLFALVQEFIAQPEPISSKRLSFSSELQLSSATVRNEMAVLEEMGYIRAPHTSSGRVPTEKGYRYFVQHLLSEASLLRLPQLAIANIHSQFREIPNEVDTWLQTATVVLAQETQTAALVTKPRTVAEHRFKHIQLIGVQGRLVLMVLVLDSGHVHQQMLVMNEPIPQNLLLQASEDLNRGAGDMSAQSLREHAQALSTLASEIGELAADAIEQMNALGSRVMYQAGFSDILPEFEESAAQQALRMLEGQTGLDPILNQMINKRVGAVQVLIAGEQQWQEFSHLSMVLGRYGTGSIIGAIGVVGPARMHYGKAISTVSYLAEMISKFLAEAHGNSDVNLLEPDFESQD